MVDLCSLIDTLTQTVLLPLAAAGAIGGVLWLGVAYVMSGIFPEMAQKARQTPKNILIGLVCLSIGPWLVVTVAGAMGLTGFTCT